MVVFLSFGVWDFLIPTFSVVGNSTFSYSSGVRFSQGAVSEIGSVRGPSEHTPVRTESVWGPSEHTPVRTESVRGPSEHTPVRTESVRGPSEHTPVRTELRLGENVSEWSLNQMCAFRFLALSGVAFLVMFLISVSVLRSAGSVS